MRSVASLPVGAPFAMSTLGAFARSLRAPVMPSISGRPCTGSKTPGWVTGPTTGVGVDHVDPPVVETDISSNVCLPAEETVPLPNTNALPWLSVRTVHPSSGLLSRLLAAAPSGCCVHVVPPSLDTATCSCAGVACGLFSCPWNMAQQTYTLPKNGLDEALSAQICSLSENVVFDCLEMSTGGIHAFLAACSCACVPVRDAVATSSVREIPMASKPLNADPVGKFDVRFE